MSDARATIRGASAAAGDPDDVLVDLGRSHARVVGGGVDVRGEIGGGITDPDGPRTLAALLGSLVDGAIAHRRDGWRLAVCAPGVSTAVALAREFADALLSSFAEPPAEVLVVSDSAAWQAGVFAGGDGAVLALGTGAVVAARSDGSVRRLDGYGLLLGDVGGGAWIGQQALRRAVRGAGPLREAARRRFGPEAGWPGLLGAPDVAARLAAFVPEVVGLAAAGDAPATQVLDAAADGLVETLADLPPALPTCLVGGLADVLRPRLAQRAPRDWTAPLGDAVDGLRHLLEHPGPFGAEIVRVRTRQARVPAAHDTDRLATEAVLSGVQDLDLWPVERLVRQLIAGHSTAVPAVLGAAAPLARAADLAATALRGAGRLVYVGAGTPGRLALQDAAELVPTFDLDPARAVVLLAGGLHAGTTAIEGAEDDVAAAAADVDRAAVGPADVVVGITASGRTPYVLAAILRARELGAVTVGMSSNPASPLSRAADIAIELPTGAEVIAGSTRLSAGTAQKIALNTLSTAALVRAGATFGPWMVDVLATNDKLRRRSLRIVREAADVDEPTAAAALTDAGGEMRVALVMLLTGSDAATARRRLTAAGSVRAAVSEAGTCG